jgi:hypothetical protein
MRAWGQVIPPEDMTALKIIAAVESCGTTIRSWLSLSVNGMLRRTPVTCARDGQLLQSLYKIYPLQTQHRTGNRSNRNRDRSEKRNLDVRKGPLPHDRHFIIHRLLMKSVYRNTISSFPFCNLSACENMRNKNCQDRRLRKSDADDFFHFLCS